MKDREAKRKNVPEMIKIDHGTEIETETETNQGTVKGQESVKDQESVLERGKEKSLIETENEAINNIILRSIL